MKIKNRLFPESGISLSNDFNHQLNTKDNMQKTIYLFAFLIAIFCLNVQSSYAHKTRDNFFPVVRTYTTPIFLTDDLAFSLMTDAGPRSYRVNGTLGFMLDQNNFFKISAEELWERLRFDFSCGKTHRWLHQF